MSDEETNNLKILQEMGWVKDPNHDLIAVKLAIDGRIIGSMDIQSINSYPENFLRALLKKKEEEGRFGFADIEEDKV
jgi:hypothetical protein